MFSVYFRFQTKDVDEKLHHSGNFFIKLHSTTGSKLTKYYLTYDEGKIKDRVETHRRIDYVA